MSGKHAQYAGLPERIFDVEYFELAGIRIQKLLAGRCTLSAMLDKSPIDEVEKYEDAAREYIAEMNKLAAELGLTMPH